MGKPVFMFPTRSNTNQAAQPHKIARGLINWIKKVEGLYYPCSEKKDANQLEGYCIADLRLFVCVCIKQVFS